MGRKTDRDTVERAKRATPGIAHALENAGIGNDMPACLTALGMFAAGIIASATEPHNAKTFFDTVVQAAMLEVRQKMENEDPFAL